MKINDGHGSYEERVIYIHVPSLKEPQEKQKQKEEIKGFKKETSLTVMKGENETIDLRNIVHMEALLDNDERHGWVDDFGSGRHICCSREGFKET